MSIRYFRNKDGGVSQVGNLTDEGAAVLLDAGHEEVTAEEYDQAMVAAAEAAPAPGVPQTSDEQAKGAVPSGGNKRQRRR